jgi:LuxR family maltose regulon positive regulatory protein
MANAKLYSPVPASWDENAPYFSERLKVRLRKAPAMRGIFIEAPVGYGKTTVAANFLLKALPQNTIRAWHRCKEDAPQAVWRKLCLFLKTLDERTATALLRLGVPDEDSLGEAGRLLRGLQCEAPTWLVDDFHQLAELAPVSVWKALLDHDCPHLCTVLISRPLPENPLPREKPGFLHLGAEDLRLTEQESLEYAARAGLALSGEEAAELHRRADGWIFPLVMHVRHYRDAKLFAPATDFEGQIREEIWNKLDAAGRDFLQRVSPFEAFSASQASGLLHVPEPPAALMAELARTAALRRDDASGLYYPPGLLLDYVRKTFHALPETTRREILQTAGDWCAANGERKKAIALYYQLRDFERILALDLSGLEDNRLLDLPDAAPDRPGHGDAPTSDNPEGITLYADALRDIAANCSQAMKVRHPLSMIHLAFEFFGQGLQADYAALCEDMAGLVETHVPEPERDRLRGELLLMEAFRRYNDIAAMGERMQRASELSGGITSLISPDNAWTFGNVSVLFMYHSEAGRLDAELADMDRYCPPYTYMAGGHGSGGRALMRAEALLNRGEAEQAEIYGHRARQEAAIREQVSVGIGTELFFGRLALLRGDEAAFAYALGAIDELAAEYPQKSNRMEADLARSFLAGLLRRPQNAVDWLRNGPPAAFTRRLFTQAVPFAHVCRARCLLLDGKPKVLLDESAASMGLAFALCSTSARIYGHIHMAAARAMRGERKEAASALWAALDLALPDALYMPFAENHDLIGPVLAKALSGKEHKEAFSRIKALAKQIKAGREAVGKEGFAEKRLSERALEVARLTTEGLSNQQIADALRISVNTVKDHLSAIRLKTGVKGRAEFNKILQERARNQVFSAIFKEKS